MSYRNPQQHVDTQSGQHIRNLQSSLAKTSSNITSKYKAEQAKIAAEEKAKREKDGIEMDRLSRIADTNAINFGTELQVHTKNKGLFNWENNKVLDDTASRVAELKGVTKLTPEEQTEATNLKGLPDVLEDDLAIVTSIMTGLKEANAQRGEEGGMVLNQDPKGFGWSIGFGNQGLEGRKWFTIDNLQAGGSQVKWHFQETGGEDHAYSSAELAAMQAASTGPFRIIPKQAKEQKEVINTSGIYKIIDSGVTTELNDLLYEGGITDTRTIKVGSKEYIETFQKYSPTLMREALLSKSKLAVAALNVNEQIAYNDFLNRKLKLKDAEEIGYGKAMTPDQISKLEDKYSDWSAKNNIGVSDRVLSTILIEEAVVESSGNPYMNKHEDLLSTINNWSVDKKSKTQAVRLQDNSKGNEDTKALPYYIKFDPKTNQTYIHTEKGAVDDRTSGAKVTKKEAFDRFGLTIEDSFEEQDKSSSKAKEAKSDKWEDDNPVSSVESTENRAARKAKDLKQTSKTSGSDWNKIPGVKK